MEPFFPYGEPLEAVERSKEGLISISKLPRFIANAIK
jgi:hypothetical protein